MKHDPECVCGRPRSWHDTGDPWSHDYRAPRTTCAFTDRAERDAARVQAEEDASALQAMRVLRADGWRVTLKCQPPTKAWVIPGDPSEYGGSSDDVLAGAGAWVCEAEDAGDDPERPYRPSEFAFAPTARDAVEKVVNQVMKATRERLER